MNSEAKKRLNKHKIKLNKRERDEIPCNNV